MVNHLWVAVSNLGCAGVEAGGVESLLKRLNLASAEHDVGLAEHAHPWQSPLAVPEYSGP